MLTGILQLIFYLKKEPESELVWTLNRIIRDFDIDIEFYKNGAVEKSSIKEHRNIVAELSEELKDKYDMVDTNISFKEHYEIGSDMELGEFDVAVFQPVNGNGILHVYEVKSFDKVVNRKKGAKQLENIMDNIGDYFFEVNTYLKLGMSNIEEHGKVKNGKIELID
ncbi:MAG: hypothetical protein ABEK36_03610 [Candidatus Aenigmatarchaeota archaeon]